MRCWFSRVALAIRSNTGSASNANFLITAGSGMIRLVHSMSFETIESKTDPDDLTFKWLISSFTRKKR